MDAYLEDTPAGRQVLVMLEECGLPYRLAPPEAVQDALPAGWLPALVDHETGLHVAGAGAILQYLAEKVSRFLPVDPDGKYAVLPWVTRSIRGPDDLRLVERALEQGPFLAGDYSIADMACFVWVRELPVDPHDVPRTHAWHETVRHRPGVRHALNVELGRRGVG